MAFGGNTGCAAAPSRANPTAIYDTSTGKWRAGPDVPAVCGKTGKEYCSLPDAPAALLPNGKILFAASSGYGDMPTHFFEFNPDDTITQVADPVLHAKESGAYYYNFVELPNGQILSTDFSKIAEIYTPTGFHEPGWEPKITRYPESVNPGGYYEISGTQFNGLSQGVATATITTLAANPVRELSLRTDSFWTSLRPAPVVAGQARLIPLSPMSGIATESRCSL